MDHTDAAGKPDYRPVFIKNLFDERGLTGNDTDFKRY